MANSEHGPVPDARHIDAAMHWHFRLEGARDELKHAHQQWLAEDEQHARAWQYIHKLLQPAVPDARLNADQAGLLIAQSEARLKRRRQSLQLLAAGGVAILAGGAGWHYRQSRDGWHTAAGESQTYTLPDGTLIQLNTASHARLQQHGQQASLQLLAGEVHIRTGRGGPLPVSTAFARYQPLGTDYTVRHLPDGDSLVVSEGQVRIQTVAGQQLLLSAGQMTRISAEGIARPQALDAAQLAWQQGLLLARQQRLGDFLDNLARYHDGLLHYHPDVADLRLSGVFPAYRSQQTLNMIAGVLPVKIGGLGRWWVRVQPA